MARKVLISAWLPFLSVLAGCGLRWGGWRGADRPAPLEPRWSLLGAFEAHADPARRLLAFKPVGPSGALFEPPFRTHKLDFPDVDLKNETQPKLSGGVFSGQVAVRNHLEKCKLVEVKVEVQWISPTSVTVGNADGIGSNGKKFWLHGDTPNKSGGSPGKAIRAWEFGVPDSTEFDFCVFVYAKWLDSTVRSWDTNQNLYDVKRFDDSVGLACGSYGIYRTTDGGRSWTQVLGSGTGSPFKINALDFAEGTGWAVGSGGKIYHTADGGQTWVEEKTGVESLATDLNDVCVVDSNNAWAVGDSGKILHWDGSKWSQQSSPVANHLYAVCFLDAQTGWVAGTYYILRTTDGGQTWSETYIGRRVNDIEFISSTHGWAVGTGGYIWESTDGGQTWTRVGEGLTSSDLNAVHIKPDGTIGAAVGDGGVILIYQNGTWSLFDSGLSKNLYDFSPAEENIGWVAAGGESVFIW